MWKLGVFFIIVALGSTSGQNIILNCLFDDYGTGDVYMCSLGHITVLDPSMNVTFNGTHTGNRTDADVDLVEIWSSNTPFIINQLFITFPNLQYLNIYDSNLATVVIPPVAQLVQLVIQGNNVSKIESNSFPNQTQLRYFYITNSGVTDIDQDAFVGLHGVEDFAFWNNNIQKLAPRTLAPLTNAKRMTFRMNRISIIDEDTFLHNKNLELLELTDNQIHQIHPRAFASLRNSLSSLYLNGNQCVSQIFRLENDQDWSAMNIALARCFGSRTRTKEINNGPMTIYN
ncbi:chondroadherin-like protein [Bradysia coprophila]|uniref:chondroadherin-like protein n=1 Tax=Bradysia coprophila TaxID=38358 RepID=UPI00187D7C0F|nr:chondroadherin-like protein [Bradysia coprophila]